MEKADFRGSKITKIFQIYIRKRSPDLPETFGSFSDVKMRLMIARWKSMSVYFLAQLKSPQYDAWKSSKSVPVCKKPENYSLLIDRAECAKREPFSPF